MAKETKELPSLGGEKNQNAELNFDAKKMLSDNSPVGKEGEKGYVAGTKINYNDRLPVEIIAETNYYRVGQIINPHKVMGQALIDQKIAKKYVAEED